MHNNNWNIFQNLQAETQFVQNNVASCNVWIYLSGEIPRCLLSRPIRSLEYCLFWAPPIFPMLVREQSAHGSALPPNIIIWSGMTCMAMYCHTAIQRETQGLIVNDAVILNRIFSKKQIWNIHSRIRLSCSERFSSLNIQNKNYFNIV